MHRHFEKWICIVECRYVEFVDRYVDISTSGIEDTNINLSKLSPTNLERFEDKSTKWNKFFRSEKTFDLF